MWSDGLMDKVSASQPRDHAFESHRGHDHDFSYDLYWLRPGSGLESG